MLSRHQQGMIDFNTVNPSLSTWKDTPPKPALGKSLGSRIISWDGYPNTNLVLVEMDTILPSSQWKIDTIFFDLVF